MAYDKYDWHSGGDFPEELTDLCGGTHAGMFIAWAIHRDLIGDCHQKRSVEWLQKVKNREATGRDFFFAVCDGRFWEDDLSEEGNAFAQFYYTGNEGCGEYMNDYEEVLCENLETMYHVEDSWGNFDKLVPQIDRRYQEWKSATA